MHTKCFRYTVTDLLLIMKHPKTNVAVVEIFEVMCGVLLKISSDPTEDLRSFLLSLCRDYNYDSTTIRLRRIARACSHSTGAKMSMSIFRRSRVVDESQ